MDRDIVYREGLGATGQIMQSYEQALRRVSIDNPTVVMVQQGCKHLDKQNLHMVISEGQAVAIWNSNVFDVTNFNGAGGMYSARWLVIDRCLVEEFAESSKSRTRREVYRIDMPKGIRDAFYSAVELIQNRESIPLDVARHRIKELLVWLDMADCFCYQAEELNLQWQIRQKIGQNISHRWNSGELSKELGMSESTLRRRLADHKQTISDVITDVRMSYALGLIQSTDFSITRIAAESGYECPSRFAARFKDRYGFAPSSIRKRAGESASF